jgi:AcrR family transcriptional regulator
MRDLAAGVGIKAASLYNHFASKQEILVRICLDGTREFYEGALERIDGVDDVRERLRALIVWRIWFNSHKRYQARVANGHLDALNRKSRKQAIAIRDTYERLFQEILLEGQEQGVWRLDHPRIIRMGILTICASLDGWYRESGPLTPHEIADVYATFILSALDGYHAGVLQAPAET